jgi:hypothetical protein
MKILAIDLGKYNRVARLFTPGTNSLNMKQSAPMVIILSNCWQKRSQNWW